MLEYFVMRYTELAKEKLKTDILDSQLAYSIRFYCMGAVGMTQECVLNDNITSAETVVRMMFNSMPESLKTVFFELYNCRRNMQNTAGKRRKLRKIRN